VNHRTKGPALLASVPIVLGLAVAASSCHSSKNAEATLAQGCSINSDCNSPLICVFSLCHDACAESRDCPQGERCVSVGVDNVCELPSESTCSATQACPGGLLCWTDMQCRNPCDALQPCIAGNVCIDNVCFSPSETADGGLDAGSDAPAGPDGSQKDSSSPVDGSNESAADQFVPNPDAGVLGFTPSNFNPSGVDAGDAGADWSNAPDANITSSCLNCLPGTPTTILQDGGTNADVYVLKSLVIDQTAALTLQGPNPVILAVLGAVDIQGQILVNGTRSNPGPGGFTSVTGSPGPGVGQPPFAPANPASNGGGGSFCGVGGTAGASSGTPSTGGATYGNATITPLVGGSAGGTASTWSSGGGALQIVAGTSIIVRTFAFINAGGGGTVNVDGSGGGASGGAILLEAPSVEIDGTLAANGGGGMSGYSSGADATANATPAPGASPYGGAGSAGTSANGSPGTAGTDAISTGGGGGGAGRIRINSATGSATITGTLSPALSTQCATQGQVH
jgi:hypothetical protein